MTMDALVAFEARERIRSDELVDWIRWGRDEWVKEVGGVVVVEGLERWAFEAEGERRGVRW